MICEVCKYDNEESVSHCSQCHSVLVKTESVNEDNKIAYSIKFFTYIFISIGLLLGIFLPLDSGYNGSYDFVLMLKICFLVIVTSLFTLGFAEIVDKLHRSENHQKQILELLKDKKKEAK